MKLTKNQTIMCAIGGVAAVGTCALVCLLFSAMSEKSEAAESLEHSRMSIQTSKVKSVEEGRRTLAVLEANRSNLVAWCQMATNLAARGDQARDAQVTEAAFQQMIKTDARRLAALPGTVAGKLVKPEFDFGHKDYVQGDRIPEKAELPTLQRRWFDIVRMVEMLAKGEVGEIVSIEVSTPKDAAAPADRGFSSRGRTVAAKPGFTRETYTLEFLATSPALVAAVNGFTADPRFFVLESLSFVRSADELVERLTVDKEKEAKEQQRMTSRRRRRQEAERAKAAPVQEEVKGQVVTDPELAAPFKVRIRVSTYDFGSREATKEVKK